MDIHPLLEELRRRDDCVVREPSGLPSLAAGHALPDDLRDFYSESGGLRFRDPPMSVVAPRRFLPINEVVLGERFADEPSSAWYLIAESDSSGTAERISIDVRPGYQGRCYDSFWDRHGVAGSMSIVASSFTEFLERLSSEGIYWTAESFVPLGDAYDD